MKANVVLAAALGAGVLALGACSSSGSGSGGDSTGAASSPTSSMPTSSMPTSSMPAPSMSAAADGQFGAACSQVPIDPSNPGSFDAMAKVPVATAASGNPVLSTLVTAVKAAGLVDTLNSAQHITVFAPDNEAFSKIPKKTLNAVLADKATLTKILTYHVVPKQLSPDQLTGTLTTLEKGTVKAEGSEPDITVGPMGGEAHVVCGNIQTANATVYIIDSVLMPPSS
jgi:uncharacterized surface protein with fasciclin (FAS1) repeats